MCSGPEAAVFRVFSSMPPNTKLAVFVADTSNNQTVRMNCQDDVKMRGVSSFASRTSGFRSPPLCSLPSCVCAVALRLWCPWFPAACRPTPSWQCLTRSPVIQRWCYLCSTWCSSVGTGEGWGLFCAGPCCTPVVCRVNACGGRSLQV